MYTEKEVKHSDFKLEEANLPAVKEENLPAVQEQTNLDADFEQAKNNIQELIKKGEATIDDLIALAKASDHPRAFEVAGNFLKQLTDMNKDVLDLYKKKKEITKENMGSQEAETINNTQIVFSGTTADFQKMLADENIIAEVEAEMAANSETIEVEQEDGNS
jgi:hypothetical protein